MAKTKKAKTMTRALAEARAVIDPSFKSSVPEVAPVARQSTVDTYEPFIPEFLAAIREGENATKWVKEKKLPFAASALRSYAWRYHREDYEAAMKVSADSVAEKAVLAASERDEAQEVIETTLVDGSVTKAVKTFDNTNRSRLAVDAYWRMAASKDPSRYGAKANAAETADLANEIMKARARIAQEKSSEPEGADA